MRKDKIDRRSRGLCAWSGCKKTASLTKGGKPGAHCDEHKEYFRQKAQAARKSRSSRGMCTQCGRRKSQPRRTKCATCRNALLEYHSLKRSDITRCLYCPEKAVPGHRACAQCRHKYKNAQDRLRFATIVAYGGKCACCGNSDREFLQIDHVDGGGNKHLRSLGGRSQSLYRLLRDSGWPDRFRVLCANCNWSRGVHGYCPHGDVQLSENVYPTQDSRVLAIECLNPRVRQPKSTGDDLVGPTHSKTT